jgi:hypothetical protein
LTPPAFDCPADAEAFIEAAKRYDELEELLGDDCDGQEFFAKLKAMGRLGELML